MYSQYGIRIYCTLEKLTVIIHGNTNSLSSVTADQTTYKLAQHDTVITDY